MGACFERNLYLNSFVVQPFAQPTCYQYEGSMRHFFLTKGFVVGDSFLIGEVQRYTFWDLRFVIFIGVDTITRIGQQFTASIGICF